ncbi:MAG: CopG family transcriptional regulator [Candidatus Ratteibacteria bacterium]|jgi:predicted transcriptional regulator
MATLTKRTTIYLDSAIHRVLKVRAVETERSVSGIVNEAVRRELAEDQEDLAVFAQRVKEPTVSYEVLLEKLKADGKL